MDIDEGHLVVIVADPNDPSIVDHTPKGMTAGVDRGYLDWYGDERFFDWHQVFNELESLAKPRGSDEGVMPWPTRLDPLGDLDFMLTVAVAALGGLGIVFSGLRVTHAGFDDDAEEIARQVTVFGMLATPGAKTVDSRLSTIHTQLNKLLPGSGFKLLDVRSERVVDGESLTCNLGDGYTLTTSLLKSLDENGKVELRCELFHEQVGEFSTLVKTPANQLFFCQRALKNGSQLLIGVGAR